MAATPATGAGVDGAAIDGAHVGIVYVDSGLPPPMAAETASADRVGGGGWSRTSRPARANPIYLDLDRGLEEYRQRWGSLPQIEIPAGAPLRPGSTGPRVELLRERLGLWPAFEFDGELADSVRAFQFAHGLPDDGIVGERTLAALNAGAAHYERLIELNLERARTLPADLGDRFILVDPVEARLWMYEDGQPVDSMRVIVGKPEMETPSLAGLVRHAVLNPYWNVPPDLVRDRIAPNVLDQGLSYLRDRRYEVLSDWSDRAEPVDPTTIDWAAVAAGTEQIRVRQLPGDGNVMGEIKFEFPNEFGVYLHDTPDRHLFEGADRRQSSGCIRLEDAQRLSRWLFGRQVYASSSEPEQYVQLPEPVPVYITYFTAAPSDNGIVFRDDVYGRDRLASARFAGAPGRRYGD